MKKSMIAAVTATLLLSGCGQIDYPETSVSSSDNKSPAAQIKIQNEDATDKSTNPETSCVTTESKTENNTESATSDTPVSSDTLDTPQSSNEENNSVAESNEPKEAIANDVQPVATEGEKTTSAPETTVELTTPAEEGTSVAVTINVAQSSDVFKMLDSLNYHAISCDGLPEYELTSPNGVVYYLNLSSAYVWRRPSLIADADNEAPLTQEVIDAIYKNWGNLNIAECSW